MKVEVLKEDIERGKKQNATSCPIALAVKRTTGRVVSVDRDMLTVGTYTEKMLGEHSLYRLPRPAQRFVSRFDMMLPVMPIQFELIN